jgi:hypothetical protein
VPVAVLLMSGALATGAAAVTAPAVWLAWLTLDEDTAASLLLIALLLLYPVAQMLMNRLTRQGMCARRRNAMMPAGIDSASARKGRLGWPIRHRWRQRSVA